MTDSTQYKIRLEKELEDITVQLRELGILNPQVKEDWIAVPQDGNISETDENVAADRAEDLEERTATLGALERQYNNINRALSKITTGTYGICEIGQEQIEEERLDANPSARTCMAHLEEEHTLPV